jgi:predicted amidohydrolase/GNAT superfamily N-acetyltransferase
MPKRAQKLFIRPATAEDLPAINSLVERVYVQMGGYSLDQLRGQINHFPEGHMIAVYEDIVVGYSASIRISEARALSSHTWREITGGGFASTHQPDGDWLYGYEVCVDPEYRGLRLGQRLYAARRKLCTDLMLKGIAFGGRIPGYARRARKFESPEAYCEAVRQRSLRDPVMSFQLHQGFECIGLLRDYLPSDAPSAGHATHMVWRNRGAEGHLVKTVSAPDRPAASVRVAVVQYLQRAIRDFEEFARIARYFVDAVSDAKSDFVLFPEYFAFQLLSIEDRELTPRESMRKLASYNDQIEELFQKLAIRYNINIIAGSHPQFTSDGRLQNVAHVFLRDGSVHEQPKIHPTPAERHWWQIEGGDVLRAIETDCGTIGVLICYDSEFPELGRHLVNQGAMMLFVPYSTEERNGHLRVRYSAHARAVENQVYVAIAGNIGNLPRFHNMDIHYAQSSIITPCDFPFARDGIAAETTPNVEQLAFADLNLDTLAQARQSGTVQNWKDRRHDLYEVLWRGPST